MQQVASQPNTYPNNNKSRSSRSTTILILALFLFAFSGLMTGFTFGAMNHPKQPHQGNINKQGTTPVAPVHTKTPERTPEVSIVPLGCPFPEGLLLSPQQADDTTLYTISSQALDESFGKCNRSNKPVQASGITFKLWLIKRIPRDSGITFSQGPQSMLNTISSSIVAKAVDKAGKTTDIEEVQGLQFIGTPQVQQSNNQGQVTWKYTLSPLLEKGDYNLLILVDWSGQTYNWSWFNIDIRKAS